MQCRIKTTIIDAFQWFSHMGIQGGVEYHPDESYHISNVRGNLLVESGDWIITSPDGNCYPYSQEAFAMSYEPVDDEKIIAPQVSQD